MVPDSQLPVNDEPTRPQSVEAETTDASGADVPPTVPTPPAGVGTPPGEDELPALPGYTIVRQIGKGGMGRVYEAVNRLGRRVALKVIRSDRLSPELAARFRNEAGALQDLDHPNIARIFEYNEHDGQAFFTMRLLRGGTLVDRFEGYRNDPRLAVELLAAVADAVACVHRRNLLHRDLKPSNILFDEEGRAYVTDFGLVKYVVSGPFAGGPPPDEGAAGEEDRPPSGAGHAETTSLTASGR